jgi:hypothetical protein
MDEDQRPPQGRRPAAATPALSDAERLILRYAAEHRLVVAGQVAYLLGLDGEAGAADIERLRAVGLLRDARRFKEAPAGVQITRAGLRMIGSDLPCPRLSDPGGYLHDVGVGWLWLAAGAGVLGPIRGMVSERQMRSADGRERERAHRFGVRLGGVGPGGRERLHYPDLVFETPSGRRVAVELELTLKSRARRENILAGYAVDARIDAVVYMVDRPSVGEAIRRSARLMGISDLVHVQPISFDAPSPASGGGAHRHRARPRARPAADRRSGAISR